MGKGSSSKVASLRHEWMVGNAHPRGHLPDFLLAYVKGFAEQGYGFVTMK
jgi:hypothetical protein